MATVSSQQVARLACELHEVNHRRLPSIFVSGDGLDQKKYPHLARNVQRLRPHEWADNPNNALNLVMRDAITALPDRTERGAGARLPISLQVCANTVFFGHADLLKLAGVQRFSAGERQSTLTALLAQRTDQSASTIGRLVRDIESLMATIINDMTRFTNNAVPHDGEKAQLAVEATIEISIGSRNRYEYSVTLGGDLFSWATELAVSNAEGTSPNLRVQLITPGDAVSQHDVYSLKMAFAQSYGLSIEAIVYEICRLAVRHLAYYYTSTPSLLAGLVEATLNQVWADRPQGWREFGVKLAGEPGYSLAMLISGSELKEVIEGFGGDPNSWLSQLKCLSLHADYLATLGFEYLREVAFPVLMCEWLRLRRLQVDTWQPDVFFNPWCWQTDFNGGVLSRMEMLELAVSDEW